MSCPVVIVKTHFLQRLKITASAANLVKTAKFKKSNITTTKSQKMKMDRTAARKQRTQLAGAGSTMMMSSQAAPEITDPVLSWGSSVTENEEVRRYIQNECTGLDRKISNIRNQLNTEDLSKRSLKKDVKHGKNEMRNLQRRSVDELERVSTNESIRQRLAEQLHSALGKLVAEDDETNVRGGANVVSPHVSPRGNENVGNSCQQSASLSSFLAGGKEEFLKLSQRIKQAAKFNENNRRMLGELENETRLIDDRIIKGNLNGERDTMSAEYDKKKRELENEKAKSRSVMEQVQRIRIKSGEYAAQIAEQVKSLIFRLGFQCPMIVNCRAYMRPELS